MVNYEAFLHLACASPQAGNHHDLLDLETSFGELCALLEKAQILLEGLFLNADSGFVANILRDDCFQRGIEANIAPNPRSHKLKPPRTHSWLGVQSWPSCKVS